MATDVVNELMIKESKFALGNKSGGNASVKPKDYICFYVSGEGIIAHAEVNSFVNKGRIKGFESYPNIFEIKNLNTFNNPIELNEDLRRQLDAFKTTSIKNWGWFVTNCHTVTENDFKILTSKKSRIINLFNLFPVIVSNWTNLNKIS